MHVQYDRLTPEDEIRLGYLCKERTRLRSLRDVLQRHLDREPTEEEWCKAGKMKDVEDLREALKEGLKARNEIINANLRLVQVVVNVYVRRTTRQYFNAADLMQDGIIVSNEKKTCGSFCSCVLMILFAGPDQSNRKVRSRYEMPIFHLCVV
mmetsp:Transcript_21560/g.49761  ORF Transcript_21560/g.49761 Transcript_21560/m.49761 type:complete len:152 (-) Transcript_21560:2061-2516(-)